MTPPTAAPLTSDTQRLTEALWPRLPRPYIPITPHPKQQAFLWLDCMEAFFGGAAGPGKSWALLAAALQYVDQPRYAALLLRRTFPDLSQPGALMDRAREWLAPTDARWDSQTHTWRFPSGATLTFGYLEHEMDVEQYRSAEFQFIGLDELTQFSERQYRFMFSRLRRLEGARVPLRMRAASNPGGEGHDWVKRWLITEGRAAGRVFIPARMEDNPSLDIAAYELSLAQLDPVLRAQLREGDWDAREAGAILRREWLRIVDECPAEARRLRAWDLAGTEVRPGADPDWTAGALIALRDGVWYIVDMRHLRAGPAAVEAAVRQAAELDTQRVPVRMEQEPGASGVNTIDHYARQVLVGWDFRGVRAMGSKQERWRILASAAEAGNVRLVRGPWNGAFLDEADGLGYGGAHDDQADAACLAMAELTRLYGRASGTVQVAAGEKQSRWRG